MNTHDQVSSIDKGDINAFAISIALSKQAADQTTGERPELYAPKFRSDQFNTELDNAYRTHIEAHLPKPKVEQSEPRHADDSFQSGNIIGSALSSQTLAETFFPKMDSPAEIQGTTSELDVGQLPSRSNVWNGWLTEGRYQPRIPKSERQDERLLGSGELIRRAPKGRRQEVVKLSGNPCRPKRHPLQKRS